MYNKFSITQRIAMHKIATITFVSFLFSLPLAAGFFPKTVHTSVKSAKLNATTLSSAFPVNGMSGIVIHRYSNDLSAITHTVVQNTPKNVSILEQSILQHDRLPSIKTAIKAGDKVIGGYLYSNVLLLAPDAATYKRITSKYKKSWVHPDLFATYLSKRGDSAANKENLAAFASSHQVGLVCIIGKSSAKLLDPISGHILAKKSLTKLPAKGEAPFFMRLGELKSQFFSSKITESYYQLMDRF